MDAEVPLAFDKGTLDELYERFNRRELVHPDPLEYLYGYDDIRDREVVAFVASSLAYGRVSQILRSISLVLERMPSPSTFLERVSHEQLRRTFRDFKHRWTTGEELAAALFGVKQVIDQYGSLHACFAACMSDGDDTALPALSAFVRELAGGGGGRPNSLIPSPMDGSACKRLNLFLRWMVRQDDVDPGDWHGVPKSKLLVPLDTHMYRTCLALKLTERKQADMRTVLEVTAGFRTIAPEDPVRYDFAITRLGIRPGTDLGSPLDERGSRYARHSRHRQPLLCGS